MADSRVLRKLSCGRCLFTQLIRASIFLNLALSELTLKGSVTTNRLVITPSANSTNADTYIQFGAGPTCVRMEHKDNNTLAFTTGMNSKTMATFEESSSRGGSRLIVENLSVTSHLDVSGGDFSIGGVKQWRLVALDTFSMGQTPIQWDIHTSDMITDCAGVIMLGGYGKFGKGEISRVFSDLPVHDHVRVVSTFHFIDNWTGDSGFMRLDAGRDGSLVHVWVDSHKVESGKGVNVCGKVTVPESKFAVPIDITMPHSKSSLKIGFGSTMTTNIPEEASWGISVVEIHIR